MKKASKMTIVAVMTAFYVFFVVNLWRMVGATALAYAVGFVVITAIIFSAINEDSANSGSAFIDEKAYDKMLVVNKSYLRVDSILNKQTNVTYEVATWKTSDDATSYSTTFSRTDKRTGYQTIYDHRTSKNVHDAISWHKEFYDRWVGDISKCLVDAPVREQNSFTSEKDE